MNTIRRQKSTFSMLALLMGTFMLAGVDSSPATRSAHLVGPISFKKGDRLEDVCLALSKASGVPTCVVTGAGKVGSTLPMDLDFKEPLEFDKALETVIKASPGAQTKSMEDGVFITANGDDIGTFLDKVYSDFDYHGAILDLLREQPMAEGRFSTDLMSYAYRGTVDIHFKGDFTLRDLLMRLARASQFQVRVCVVNPKPVNDPDKTFLLRSLILMSYGK